MTSPNAVFLKFSFKMYASLWAQSQNLNLSQGNSFVKKKLQGACKDLKSPTIYPNYDFFFSF